MHRLGVLFLAFLISGAPVFCRQETAVCGTHRDQSAETLFLHRQAVRARAGKRPARAPLAAGMQAARDIGNIAVVEDADGAVTRLNQFNLMGKTLRFTPSGAGAARYRYAVTDGGYDEASATRGVTLGLGDDDSLRIDLPFNFPFFGASYQQIWVNSDGNLTFNSGDKVITDRSLGRMTAGEPRISPLFEDLDPSRSGVVRALAEPSRFLVTWLATPEYQAAGTGATQTFQVALYPDGRIELAYFQVTSSNAVVGIAPGNLRGNTNLVSFRNDPSGEYSSAVVERFADRLEVDMVAVAQGFYQTHEDAYDYLAVFNSMDIAAGSAAVAFENTVRSNRTGIGERPFDIGREYGSAARLQAALNLGHLSQYPRDPAGLVAARRDAGDTPMSILGHEAGHLFLALASVRAPNDPLARPMLGAQQVHWSFRFNSEASLVEGERIVDRGPEVSPRFLTTDTAQGYSPLDQYLMGLRPPSEVPPSFYVAGVPAFLAEAHPRRNYPLDGSRVDVSVDDVIRAEGRRIPNHTVAQRRFRMAFILLVARGSTPKAEDLEQIETYRREFEPYFARVTENRAWMDATLRRSLKLSLQPAAGVLAGGAALASVNLATPPATALTIDLQTPNGNGQTPATVVIPAGAASATFTVTGLRPGVEEITAVPRDSAWETAFARVQVSAPSAVRIEALSGDRQTGVSGAPLPEPVVVRVTDDNRLPYPGVRLQAAVTGGSLNAATAVTDGSGQATFRWTLGAAPSNQLRISIDGGVAALTVNAGSAVAVAASVVSAASYAAGLAPDSFGAVMGVNLAGGAALQAPERWPDTLGGVRVLLNGRALALLYVSDRQINFYVPADAAFGDGVLTVRTASGAELSLPVAVEPVLPGIFFDAATGYGAVLRAGTGQTTFEQPARVDDYIEIYCTGLGPTHVSDGLAQTIYRPTVYIGGIPSVVQYSGASGVPGLYQVNAQIPFGIAPGVQSVVVRVGTAASNEVKINVR